MNKYFSETFFFFFNMYASDPLFHFYTKAPVLGLHWCADPARKLSIAVGHVSHTSPRTNLCTVVADGTPRRLYSQDPG